MSLPGEYMSDEEFLGNYVIAYNKSGTFGIVGKDAKSPTDYVYAYFDGPEGHWAFWNRDFQNWEMLENQRIIGLLNMVIFPETAG